MRFGIAFIELLLTVEITPSCLTVSGQQIKKQPEPVQNGKRVRGRMSRNSKDARYRMKARQECAGGNILELAGDAEDLLSEVLCMKKLKGETKTDNMPTVNKEMTE